MLTTCARLFWKFLSPEEREARAAALEKVLRAGLGAAKTPSLKSAWFNALRDVARTPATVAWLESVWRKSETVPGLTLAEPDFIVLALELAVREVARGRRSSTSSTRGSRTRIGRRSSSSSCRRCRPTSATRDAFFDGCRT